MQKGDMELKIYSSSGYCSANGIFYSLREPYQIPEDASMDAATFVLSRPHGGTTALVDAVTGAHVTYAELRRRAAAVAAGLRRLGVRRGDVVLLVAPNSIHFPAIALGVLSAGAVLSTANPLFTAAEIGKQMDDSLPALVFTTPELLPKFSGAHVRIVVIGPGYKDSVACSLEQMLESNSGCLAADSVPVRAEDTAVVLYSSGTTGKSKGVMSTHGNLIAMTAISRSVIGNDVYLCIIPLFHMYGFATLVCGVLGAGGTLVVAPTFSLESMLSAAEKFKVTHIPTVPTVISRLCKSPAVARRYDLNSVKEVMGSGAPMGREQMERFRSLFPHIGFLQMYGLTETSGVTTWSHGNDVRHYGSVGILMPNVEAKIVDIKTGRPMPPNATGELCFRGPMVMKGYLNDEAATSLAIDSEGWLHTGDICYINQEGRIYVVDRIKELIKYKGLQVAPAELEELLLSLPEIEDCAVIPYPDEDAGEIPMAFIAKKNGSHLTAQDVMDFVTKEVAPHKKIRRVAFVEYIPRSPSGKILRKHLKSRIHQQQHINSKL